MTKSIIDQRDVTVLSEDETEVTYRFELSSAGDVATMLISAADASGQKIKLRDGDHYIGTVLQAQADMIEMGLHVNEHDPDMMKDIEAFHQKFGLEYTGKPRILEPELFDFRHKFMLEELEEWRNEQGKLIEALTSDGGKADVRDITNGLHQQLDALADLMYVALGTAYLQFGRLKFNEAWRRVQTANMAKIRCEKVEDSKRGSTFDVVKPEGWEAPDHHDLVKDHAHKPYVKTGEVNEAYLDPATAGRTDTVEKVA